MSDCPIDKGFEFQTQNGQSRCVYRDAPENFVNLIPNQMIIARGDKIPNPLTVESLQSYDPGLYAMYTTERDRVKQELEIVSKKIDKTKKINGAFVRLQEAENARDKAPDAYQQARTMYYTQTVGETWKEQEKNRIAKAEVDPLIARYKDSKENATKEFDAQRKTMDVVNGLKDKVLSLKDEVKYAATTLTTQVDKLQNQINKDRRGRQKETNITFWNWLDTLMNVIIVAVLIASIFLIYPKARKYMMPKPAYGITISQPAVRV